MINPWYMEQPFRRLRNPLSVKDLNTLKRFYTVQLGLSQALLEAKPLGTCKTTTSEEKVYQDILHAEEEDVSQTNSISQKDVSKEMS